MARRSPSKSLDFEQTAELPVLHFGIAGQPVATQQAPDPIAETATWITSTSPSDSHALRIAELERELGELRSTLSERESLLRRLRAQVIVDPPGPEVDSEIDPVGIVNVQGFVDAQSTDVLQGTAPVLPPSVTGGPAPTRLLVRTAGNSGIAHVLGRRSTIGRTPDNDIRIDTPIVSRHHAVVLSVGEDTYLEDLHSANGVRVNGRRVTRQALAEGDIIDVGESRFRFLLKRT
jgi:hypothetical protein